MPSKNRWLRSQVLDEVVAVLGLSWGEVVLVEVALAAAGAAHVNDRDHEPAGGEVGRRCARAGAVATIRVLLRITGKRPGAGVLPFSDGNVIVAPSWTPSSIVIHWCSEKVDGYVAGGSDEGTGDACAVPAAGLIPTTAKVAHAEIVRQRRRIRALRAGPSRRRIIPPVQTSDGRSLPRGGEGVKRQPLSCPRGFPHAPERTRTSTDHTVHKALNPVARV
jgi:hypothetical protein